VETSHFFFIIIFKFIICYLKGIIMSDYECAGGGLKLKGVSDKAIKKKKKKQKKAEKKERQLITIAKPENVNDARREMAASGLANKFVSSSKMTSLEMEAEAERLQKDQLAKHHQQVADFKKKQQELAEIESTAANKTKPVVYKTKAELVFERYNQRRLDEKILKRAEKSHKEHVEVYNQHLDSISEFHDIPKVSWTK
jgi:protein FAM32A